MSGRGGVGTQQHGWRGGRGGRGGRGSGGAMGGPWYAPNSGRGGHGGFAGAGGGGGGGRRPGRGGDGPMGHRHEDPRRDARVQKNTDRGRGRGGRGRGGRGRGGRGRGGQELGVGPGTTNALHTWNAGKTYDQRLMAPRQQVEGVNYDSRLNEFGQGPPVEDGKLSVEGVQRERLMQSDALILEDADVRAGRFSAVDLSSRDVQSLATRATLTQEPDARWDFLLQRHRKVDKEDGSVSSEAVRDRFLSALLLPGDPFAFNPNLGRVDGGALIEGNDQTAEEMMEEMIREEGAGPMDYVDGADGQPNPQAGRFMDA